MSLISTLIKGSFLAMALAFWQLYLQPIWNAWIIAQGKTVGVGETALGYFFVVMLSWGAASIVTRKVSPEE